MRMAQQPILQKFTYAYDGCWRKRLQIAIFEMRYFLPLYVHLAQLNPLSRLRKTSWSFELLYKWVDARGILILLTSGWAFSYPNNTPVADLNVLYDNKLRR